jgi:hypothetical protein
MDQAALHRLMAATSIDNSIARLYETYRVAVFTRVSSPPTKP